MAMNKRQKAIAAAVEPGKAYAIDDALKIVKDNSKAKFVEAVDVSVRLGVDARKSDQQAVSYTHLDVYKRQGDDTPIISGSARLALEGDQSEIGVPAILKLVDALDTWIPEPERDVDKPFLMPVEDVFSISGRGPVVTGRIERGIIKVGAEIELSLIHI